jgi:hypothetical protein
MLRLAFCPLSSKPAPNPNATGDLRRPAVQKIPLSDDIFLIDNFLSPTEAQLWIDATEAMGYTAAPVTTARGPVMRPDIRNNRRIMLDTPDRAEALWHRAAPLMPDRTSWRPSGLNERLRFYRYDPGQRFAPHFDGYFARSSDERSFLTFIVYLNDGFEGGQTRFEGVTVKPRIGTALCFRHHLLHEGAPVLEGRKYVLRSDVMYRRID